MEGSGENGSEPRKQGISGVFEPATKPKLFYENQDDEMLFITKDEKAQTKIISPLNMKIRNGQGKWALRQVLYKYVPSKLIERPKTGFAVPIGLWLRGPLCQWAESLLESSRLSQDGYLDVALVRQIWKEHLSGKSDWTSRLWSILMFQSWLDEQK